MTLNLTHDLDSQDAVEIELDAALIAEMERTTGLPAAQFLQQFQASMSSLDIDGWQTPAWVYAVEPTPKSS